MDLLESEQQLDPAAVGMTRCTGLSRVDRLRQQSSQHHGLRTLLTHLGRCLGQALPDRRQGITRIQQEWFLAGHRQLQAHTGFRRTVAFQVNKEQPLGCSDPAVSGDNAASGRILFQYIMHQAHLAFRQPERIRQGKQHGRMIKGGGTEWLVMVGSGIRGNFKQSMMSCQAV